MAEPKTKETELTAADLASYGIPPCSTKDQTEGKLHEVTGKIEEEVERQRTIPNLKSQDRTETAAAKFKIDRPC